MRRAVPFLVLSACTFIHVPLGVSPPPPSRIEFVNGFAVPVCAVNLWRAEQAASEAEANWLELDDVRELGPGQRVLVGIRLKDGPYRVRALGCDGTVLVEGEVRGLRNDLELVLEPNAFQSARPSPQM